MSDTAQVEEVTALRAAWDREHQWRREAEADARDERQNRRDIFRMWEECAAKYTATKERAEAAERVVADIEDLLSDLKELPAKFADAWDQGFDKGVAAGQTTANLVWCNPYRAALSEPQPVSVDRVPPDCWPTCECPHECPHEWPVVEPMETESDACTCSSYFGCSEYARDCPRHGVEARRTVR